LRLAAPNAQPKPDIIDGEFEELNDG
jgi:hypothetical protein